MTPRRYAVVAGGGTGGHVLPALAVARALVALGHQPESIEFVGSRRGQEGVLLAGEGFPMLLLGGRGIARRLDWDSLVANAGAVVGLLGASAQALRAVRSWRPSVVVSVGGYASFPAGMAAVVLGVPLVLVNVDAVPGLVHRLLGRFAAASAVVAEQTTLPRAVVTGTPVRAEIAAVDRSAGGVAAARQALDLPPGRATVAVVGGSLGARRLNEAAAAMARAYEDRDDVTIYHVIGQRDWEATSPACVPEGGGGGLCYRTVPFERRMDLLYAAADLFVCRAGAMTVAELAVAGVPSVLVPLPGAPSDHQTANAVGAGRPRGGVAAARPPVRRAGVGASGGGAARRSVRAGGDGRGGTGPGPSRRRGPGGRAGGVPCPLSVVPARRPRAPGRPTTAPGRPHSGSTSPGGSTWSGWAGPG